MLGTPLVVNVMGFKIIKTGVNISYVVYSVINNGLPRTCEDY
jgi:multisubunit Na+/H+ antiporter MnhC subunit